MSHSMGVTDNVGAWLVGASGVPALAMVPASLPGPTECMMTGTVGRRGRAPIPHRQVLHVVPRRGGGSWRRSPLEGLDFERVPANAEIWEKVRRKLSAGVMPPLGNPRPSKAESDDFLQVLTARLDSVTPAPAPVALRRLNRTEYANVIRDLLGLKIDPATLLPPDAASKGFDNISAVLSTSPALIQGYLDAGMKISRLAVGDRSLEPERTVYRTPAALNQQSQLEGLPLATRGGVRLSHFFPLDAEYEISVEAGPGASGFMRRAPGPCRASTSRSTVAPCRCNPQAARRRTRPPRMAPRASRSRPASARSRPRSSTRRARRA